MSFSSPQPHDAWEYSKDARDGGDCMQHAAASCCRLLPGEKTFKRRGGLAFTHFSASPPNMARKANICISAWVHCYMMPEKTPVYNIREPMVSRVTAKYCSIEEHNRD